jgi:hypothetical protein
MRDFEAERLSERINSMLESEYETAKATLQPIRSQFMASGSYGTSTYLVKRNQPLREAFKAALARMARTVFRAAGDDERAPAILEKGGRGLAEQIVGHAEFETHSLFGNLDRDGKIHHGLRNHLERYIRDACDDFGYGLAGGEPLKQEQPHPTIAQTNDGNASQRAVQKSYSQLLKEIDAVLNAIGFHAFEDEKQSELRELSEAVRAESGKLVPNPTNVGVAAERFAQKLNALGLESQAQAVKAVLTDLTTETHLS